MIQFYISGLEVKQYAILHEDGDISGDVGIEIRLAHKLNPEERSVSVAPLFKIGNNGEDPFIQIQVALSVTLTEESWNNQIKFNEESYIIPKALMLHILVIAGGATRGILYEKSSQTDRYKSIILPAINFTEMVTEDVPYDVNNFMTEEE